MPKVKVLLLAASAATVFLVAAPAGASAAYNVPYGSEALAAFTVGETLTPTTVVGANNDCRTSAEHPYPVVLVHGTIEDEGAN